jgi:PAS domain S-box-containing protein
MSQSRERIDQLTGELMDAQQRITRLEEDLSVLKKRHEENLEKLEILNRHFALANDIMYIYDTNFNVLSVSPNAEELIQANATLQQEIHVPRRTEEGLHSSEEMYRLLVENANEGIFVAQDGVLKFVNPMISKISGYTQEELTARPFDHLIHPDDRDAVLDRHQRRMEGEALPEIYRFRVLSKSGGIRWIEVNAVPITWEGRVAALTFLVDITARKNAEDELKRSEAKYRMLYDGIVDGFVLVDMDGRIREFNPSFSRMLGYEPEEFRDLTYCDLTPAVWHAGEADIIKNQIMVRGYSESYEKEYRKKDGTVFPIELRTYLLRDDDGQPQAMWAIVRDVSERKKAEKAIRESEAILRGLAENLPGAVYQFYARENGEVGVRYMSERTLDLLGLDSRPDDFFERFTACVEPEDREGFLSSIRTAVNTESKWEHEVRFKTPSGEDRYVRGMSRPRRFGRELVFDGVLLDVTDRRKAEEELLRHRERLEEMVMARTSELTDTLGKLTQEIEGRKRTEATLRFREMELQNRGSELEEMNAALKVLLRQREEDKASTEMNIIANMKTFILPYIEKLEAMGLEENRMRAVSMIKSHLNEITSPFTRRISSEYLGFTPAEIQVASLIRDGKCSKEIAKLLNISLNTIHTYRFNIRRKAGLKNNKVNLRSYLQTLE